MMDWCKPEAHKNLNRSPDYSNKLPVSDCCLTPTQLYYAENKLVFNEMMMRSA
jgi:hypothetical protein